MKSQPTLNYSRLSRAVSRRAVNVPGPDSESTLTNNNRVRKAFLRMCDSLGTAENRELQPSCSQQLEPPQLTNEPFDDEINYLLITTPSMSKPEFLKRMDDGMFRKKPVDIENTYDPMDHQYAKSEYVLSKPTMDPDNVMTSGQNQTKSTSAIADERCTTAAGDGVNNDEQVQVVSDRSATSKVIFTGFLLFFILGLVKNVQQNN